MSSFVPVLQISLFLFVTWAFGNLFKYCKLSPIIGELIAGVLLGPPGFNIVPITDALNLVGEIGIIMLLASAGMRFDLRNFFSMGARVAVIAAIGTIVPFLLGSIVMLIFGYEYFPVAVAAGISICPNSIGLVTKLLMEVKVMESDFGKLIMASAFCLDALALIAVSLLESATSEPHVNAASVILPLLWTVLFVVFGFLGALYVVPLLLTHLLAIIPNFPVSKRSCFHDQIVTGCALALTLCYSYVGSLLASYLLGAFIAGTAFFHSPVTRVAWTRFLKRMMEWFIRVFFAATIGFTVPLNVMMTGTAFGQGLLLFIVAIGGKIGCGFGASKDKLLVGLGLTGRGEFSYVVAAELTTRFAHGDPNKPLLTQDAYAVVMWGLVLSTFFSPLLFRSYLNYCVNNGLVQTSSSTPKDPSATPLPGSDGKAAPFLKDLEMASTKQDGSPSTPCPVPSRGLVGSESVSDLNSISMIRSESQMSASQAGSEMSDAVMV